MARKKLSVEEERQRNREYQRKRRQKINGDQDSRREYLEKERQRWKDRVLDKKVKTIGDQGPREKRYRRMYWRKAQEKSRKSKRTQIAMQEVDTPPDSPLDQSMEVEVPSTSSRALAGKKERGKARKRHSREIKALKEKIEQLTRERNRLTKQKWRKKESDKSNGKQKKRKRKTDSPQTLTEKMTSGSQLRNPNIKKALLFHNVLCQELNVNKQHPVLRRQATYKQIKQPVLALSGKLLKKYRLIHRTRQFGLTYKLLRERKQQALKKAGFLEGIRQTVQDFFLSMSRMTTDKNDTVTRKKIKKQRMIMSDTMRNLHCEFTKKNSNIKLSYSSFCSLRPFYITAPKQSDRKTCLCQLHENANLMLQVLRSLDVVKSNKLTDSFQLVCCSPSTEACLLRTCLRCQNKHTVLSQEKSGINVEWKQWKRVQEQKASGIHFNMKLTMHNGSLSELFDQYQEKLRSETTTHVCLVHNQTKSCRNVIETCAANTAIVHVDFSESWKCKYASEIQACHFGQNLPQLTLHTGMFYTKDEKSAFCTVSECKRQDAAAIWTHMEPVLQDIRKKHPMVTSLHFWSDGPSKQYKNKKNFFLLSEIPSKLGFNKTSWNYFPTSHGKGAPDGIGGTVKRTADRLILQGKDIVGGKEFLDKITNSLNNVQLYHIDEKDMEKYDKLLMSSHLKQVPATRKIHQVIPHESSVSFRQLSCFCSESLVCQCFNPATLELNDRTEEQPAKTKKKGPLAMLMMEMEEEMVEEDIGETDVWADEEMDVGPMKGPEGTEVGVAMDNIEEGEWLAVVYDDHWWLAKCLDVDTEHQDVKVEFMHPHGPGAHFHPKQGKGDVCFCPIQDILLKLKGRACPLQSSRTREIYSIEPDVMDFIERTHIQRQLPKPSNPAEEN